MSGFFSLSDLQFYIFKLLIFTSPLKFQTILTGSTVRLPF
ncbi:hypothetical protein Cabys_2642 [Caldithrix abyssi DSM 13497]|uniref:Uncharacterized protein n=1 Tax=Caldithrix abyssi DSM 13497 TaxID=880073 RepID=A0A1J1C9Q3_CALAY|nr:hypothetical protein Cabys_2642 [Caldithrix abyssi DSM 13497]